MKEAIINTISIYTPFTYSTIEDLYEITKSFDRIIEILKESQELGEDPIYLAHNQTLYTIN